MTRIGEAATVNGVLTVFIREVASVILGVTRGKLGVGGELGPESPMTGGVCFIREGTVLSEWGTVLESVEGGEARQEDVESEWADVQYNFEG